MLHEAVRSKRGGRGRRPAPRPAGLRPWVIPFDYGARFELTGRPGNVLQDVINIGPDGVFVATAVGYGFDEDCGRAVHILGQQSKAPLELPFSPATVTLGQLPAEALAQGFRVSPRFDAVVFGAPAAAPQAEGRTVTKEPVAGIFAGRVLERIKTPGVVSFLFSMVDSATGRELQDEPAHNLAALGISNGERPFRPLAQPLTFVPRSTIRLQVIERSVDTRGTLFIVLFGYRIITGTHCPEPLARTVSARALVPGETLASERIIPFDYVGVLPLCGRPGNLVEAEIPINAEGGFVATSLGYGLEPADGGGDLLWEKVAQAGAVLVPGGEPNTFVPDTTASVTEKDLEVWDESRKVDLAKLPLEAFPPERLRQGIRIRPSHLRFAFVNLGAGLELGQVPLALLPELFESLNRPEAVSFRYEISDTGTGRDLQNQPLHNIAGLGIANGDRPFKRLARPMIFLPRSTIRIRVEERFGRGNLFFVFQGHKLLGVTGRGER